ncbi:MAG: glycoside hydrolase [Acidobacteriota bacterium]|nr:glycoside hydrolase [Acidobacteriota bacterium]
MTRTILTLAGALLVGAPLAAQWNPVQPIDVAAALEWRMIGPFRASRTKAAAGIPTQPNVFYIGAVNGGVWKTTDYGRTWNPIFDDMPTGSIGAIAIAPSNPNIIYVGSGEGLQRPDLSTGNGMYRSEDAGKTWTHLGTLRDAQQIPQIVVHPTDPGRLYVAALGHPYGPNEERGIFRSTNGGRSFDKVLYKGPDVGGVDIVMDPSNPDILYAAMWEARQGPWENGQFTGPGSAIYKSVDGGTTWRPIVKGIPTFTDHNLGRIGLTIAPSMPSRLFATVEASRDGGLYRSDDAGESWSLVNSDARVTMRSSDFAEVKVHPKHPDIVYTGSIAVWKSTDGGRNFTSVRGAPGGDDYHRLWINPINPDIMLFVADQGAIVTVNGGDTFSSWYNQPTAQLYHVITDNAFPYRVCSGQQESGSACVPSRGDKGQITLQDWETVGVDEYGYAAPDPLNPDIIYGGRITRFDRRTGQLQNITPRPLRDGNSRVLRTAPVLFSPINPRTLFFATNVLWKTNTGGDSWEEISPDLSRETWEAPANVGKFRGTPAAAATRRGVIYTVAPSYLDENIIWAGTDDGLIHVTRDGGTSWQNVTPPAIGPWAKVSLMDASHFDRDTAYAAVNTIRLDDHRPHIYRTRDAGKSWTRIVEGIPDGGTVNVVREDPKARGLLYAGTEQAVYVSTDDGDHWQSLRLNMPATSVRDLVIKDDDVVIGTHGRSFWILDNITPLRQAAAARDAREAFLFAPADAWRVRWNMNTDTPLPPEEPAGKNPPDGAMIDYWLKQPASGVVLEIVDPAGAIVRTFSSIDPPAYTVEGETPRVNFPSWWVQPPATLRSAQGLHRSVWDLKYAPPRAFSYSYPIAAIPGNTPREPQGLSVQPGRYTVRLTAHGSTLERPLTVKMDPRVTTPVADLQLQFDLSKALYDGINRAHDAIARMRQTRGNAAVTPGETALMRVHQQMVSMLGLLQEADVKPTTQVIAAVRELGSALEVAIAER